MPRIWTHFYFLCLLIFIQGCGDKENICSESYPNGQVMFEVHCDSWTGDYQGEMKTYNPEGRLIKRSFYVDDILEDTLFSYYPETGLIKEISEMKGGKKDGFSATYYPDGVTPFSECDYIEDIRFGKYRRFRPDGTPLATFTFAFNKRHGGFAVFRSSGMPYLTGEFVMDQIDGEIRLFNDEGAVIDAQDWAPGQEQNPEEMGYQSTLTITIPNEGKAFIKGDSVWIQTH
ncbi:MAG: hypothetical protein KDD99_06490 [Bacteroidetes bacterium]|nr:hypothetical protein [Bacteroidota bacterium]